MEKKNILIYSGIVVAGLGAMVAMVLFLRSRSAPPAETEALAKPATQAATGKALPPPQQSAGVRKYEPLDQVPTAKTSGTNVKIYR